MPQWAGMGVTSAVDGFQRRHPVVGFPLAVVYKFFDDQGVYLAALITYYGFLSLFPLLLLLAAVLGFVLRDDPDLQQRILDSTISQFPVIGDQLRGPQGLQGSGVALVVGALVAIYGALGVGQALQNALNIAWAVPRNDRPNPLKARGRSLLIVLTGGLAVLATTTVSVLAGALGAPGGVLDGLVVDRGRGRRRARQHGDLRRRVPHRLRHPPARASTCSPVPSSPRSCGS